MCILVLFHQLSIFTKNRRVTGKPVGLHFLALGSYFILFSPVFPPFWLFIPFYQYVMVCNGKSALNFQCLFATKEIPLILPRFCVVSVVVLCVCENKFVLNPKCVFQCFLIAKNFAQVLIIHALSP